jgi:hypothetical protein
MAVRITCIRKAGGYHENPYVAISYLQWIEDGAANTGESSREEMYDWIVNKGGYAYVQSGLSKTKLIGAISPRGTRYVKTEANETEKDNLLKLPECR